MILTFACKSRRAVTCEIEYLQRLAALFERHLEQTEFVIRCIDHHDEFTHLTDSHGLDEFDHGTRRTPSHDPNRNGARNHQD